MSFKKLAKATKRLSDPKVLERLIIEAAEQYEAEMVDLNTGQLDGGKLSTGENVKPKYELDSYSEFKKAIGSKSSPIPDLKLEGDFHSGFFVEFKDNFMLFDSSDDKTSKLETKYSSDIFGLTDKNKGEVSELIAEDFINLFENELFK